jgi:hypothetical protein
VKAGILIEEMDGRHRERWSEFLRASYQFLASLEPREGYREGGSTVSMYHKKL